MVFQSTRPARGATSRLLDNLINVNGFQSTRPARGATYEHEFINISTEFQSTRPARGATQHPRQAVDGAGISIHAPREGRDSTQTVEIGMDFTISIHAPREGRDSAAYQVRLAKSISIHAPREGRDSPQHVDDSGARISIHAPREGRDILASAVEW